MFPAASEAVLLHLGTRFHRTGSNEFSIEVVQLEDNKGRISTKIQGPPNKLFGTPPYISIPMTITVANDRNSITIEESGQTVTLRPGAWSGWTDFVFPFNPLIKIHGISRFHLITSQPEVKLYLSPINFDPRIFRPASTSPRRRNGRRSSRATTASTKRSAGRSIRGRFPRGSRTSRCSGMT